MNLKYQILNLKYQNIFEFRFSNFEFSALQKGQALITFLFFVIVGITITSAAILIILTNSISATKLEQGTLALSIAESGAENAILRLLRNPSYTGEELAVGEGSAVIEVAGTDPMIIISQGKIGNSIKKIRVEMGYNNNVLTVLSWKEIF